jgi:hypothetical protein
MAKKFVCVTQSDGITTFNGASGTQYTSYLGVGFVVTDSVDIEHFAKNKRFVVEGLFSKPKLVVPVVKSLAEDLAGLKLTKKSVDTLCALYDNLDVLRSEVFKGNDLTGDINKTDADKVRKFIIPNDDNLDNIGDKV